MIYGFYLKYTSFIGVKRKIYSRITINNRLDNIWYPACKEKTEFFWKKAIFLGMLTVLQQRKYSDMIKNKSAIFWYSP